MQDLKQFLDLNLIQYEENVSFKSLTTLGVGGVALLVCYVKNIIELKNLIKFLNKNKIKWRVLGDGSNTLASDKDYNGVIIKLKDKLCSKAFLREDYVFVYAGANLTKLVLDVAKLGLSGLENLAGIFGQVGGAIRGNAGAYGTTISDFIFMVIAMDKYGNLKVFNKTSCQFKYRESIFKHKNLVIVGCILKLQKADKKGCVTTVNMILNKRKNFFAEGGNAGSIFKNPVNNFAGKLIEEAGVMPTKNYGARFCSFHKNVIITDEKTTSQDVSKFIAKIKKRVYNKFMIELEEEIYRLK